VRDQDEQFFDDEDNFFDLDDDNQQYKQPKKVKEPINLQITKETPNKQNVSNNSMNHSGIMNESVKNLNDHRCLVNTANYS
jgi:hypothetical protein